MYTITSMLLPTYNNTEQQYLSNSHLQFSILWHPDSVPMNSRTHTDSQMHDKILLARTMQQNTQWPILQKQKNPSHNHSCMINTEQMGYNESCTHLANSIQGENKILYKICIVILHRMLHIQVNSCTQYAFTCKKEAVPLSSYLCNSKTIITEIWKHFCDQNKTTKAAKNISTP